MTLRTSEALTASEQITKTQLINNENQGRLNPRTVGANYPYSNFPSPHIPSLCPTPLLRPLLLPLQNVGSSIKPEKIFIGVCQVHFGAVSTLENPHPLMTTRVCTLCKS